MNFVLFTFNSPIKTNSPTDAKKSMNSYEYKKCNASNNIGNNNTDRSVPAITVMPTRNTMLANDTCSSLTAFCFFCSIFCQLPVLLWEQLENNRLQFFRFLRIT